VGDFEKEEIGRHKGIWKKNKGNFWRLRTVKGVIYESPETTQGKTSGRTLTGNFRGKRKEREGEEGKVEIKGVHRVGPYSGQ